MKDDSDIDKIINFSKTLQNRLDYFIEARVIYFQNKQQPTRKVLLQAWDETSVHFDTMLHYLREKRPVKELESVGLVGASLDLKLILVEQSLQELIEVEESFQREGGLVDEKQPPSRWRFQNRIKKSWEKYLDHANTMLGSLGSAGVPGADAIDEFKSVIEKILKWRRRA